MVQYYFSCALFIFLFLYYFVETMVDAFIGFSDEGRDYAMDVIKEQGLEKWVSKLHRYSCFRHIVYVIILGIISYMLVFKADITKYEDGTTTVKVESNKI